MYSDPFFLDEVVLRSLAASDSDTWYETRTWTTPTCTHCNTLPCVMTLWCLLEPVYRAGVRTHSSSLYQRYQLHVLDNPNVCTNVNLLPRLHFEADLQLVPVLPVKGGKTENTIKFPKSKPVFLPATTLPNSLSSFLPRSPF